MIPERLAEIELYMGATAWLGMALTIAANTLAILTRKAREASVKKGSRLRTIGPGEVVVSEKELNVLLILERYARKHGPESIDYAIEALDALRSQKECQP